MKKLSVKFKLLTGCFIAIIFLTNYVEAQFVPGTNYPSGSFPSAFGHNNYVGPGSAGFVAGMNNKSQGYTSVCFGEHSEASSNYSMTFGTHCYSDSYYSFSIGHRSEARNDFSMVYGKYLKATGHTAFVIGSGINPMGDIPASGYQLTNPHDNSLMIGFNSTIPTVFVGPSNGVDENGNGTVGKVGIGTTNLPDNLNSGAIDISYYTLYVDGGMLADEVRVRTSWADYVFKDDYKLKPLFEVESFINKNGHLPNVPSAEEVENGGIELGEITKIQQEKIEELTLYIIEQQKQIDELKMQMKAVLSQQDNE